MLATLVYRLKRPYHFFKTGLLNGLVAQFRYGFPQRKLKILTITGTDGKTTSTTLLFQVLKTAGKKVGLISTVAAYLGDEQLDTGFHVTAPQPSEIYRLMRRMVKEGYEYLILETTSHGIYQYRTWGIRPTVAGVTNIDREHLDYHLTYENYVEAKTLLLKQAKQVVINSEDESFALIKRQLPKRVKVWTYNSETLLSKDVRAAMNQRFVEPFNKMNTRLVAKMADVLDIPSTAVAEAIKSFPGVPGRMQWIPNTQGIQVVIDFAHTPQALAEALQALKMTMKRQELPGKLIAIFGCASERDRGKRPGMTQAAVELADVAVLTAEDPRREDIWSIIREMKEQLTFGHNKLVSIADRGQAIEFAISELAQPGDVVGLFGKGHETSMNLGGVELPWSEETAVHQALKKRQRLTS